MEEDKTLPHGLGSLTNRKMPYPIQNLLWLDEPNISSRQLELKRPQGWGFLKIIVLETARKHPISLLRRG